MLKRTGTASLPLHGGRVPKWLAGRMSVLGAAIVEVIVHTEGRGALLSRLADPYWFQAFGAVLGMDWHSSGITTSVMGALKSGLKDRSSELGITVCGGRGRHSMRTPEELMTVAYRTGLDGEELTRTSRLVAKVDNTAVQDGFNLYLHSFVIADDGSWVVVQQGMNGPAGEARRYHWCSKNMTSFVDSPHDAVVGPNQGMIVNLADKRARDAREAALSIVSLGTENATREIIAVISDRNLAMPRHHEVRPTDVFIRRLHGVLALAGEKGVAGFEDLLLVEGLGPRTMQALALVAEVAFGAPSRFEDPARFAFAHGGKDGHPHPVPTRVYDQTIHTLHDVLARARIGRFEKIEAFKRLEGHARRLELESNGPSLSEIIEDEWRASEKRGGMTARGPVQTRGMDPRCRAKQSFFAARQLDLFSKQQG